MDYSIIFIFYNTVEILGLIILNFKNIKITKNVIYNLYSNIFKYLIILKNF